MNWLSSFWNQKNKQYRNFQIMFTFLTVHFFFPSLSYAFTPDVAITSFMRMGAIFGVTSYPVSEQSFVWRILAVSNVMTLAFMCFLLQIGLKQFYPVLVPLCFMKGLCSISNLIVFIFVMHFPAFFLIFLWDGINVWMFIYFTSHAKRAIEAHPRVPLVPRFLN